MQWEVYMRILEEKPAAILVNLDVAPPIPQPDLPVLFRLRVAMHQPDANGFPGTAESHTLNGMEEVIMAAAEKDGAEYVGRLTRSGFRDFYVYAPLDCPLGLRLPSQLTDFPDYPVDITLTDDADWEFYRGFLLPDEEEMQAVLNHQVLNSLLAQGDDLTAPREIAHYLYFPTPEARTHFCLAIEGDGYTVQDENTLDEETDKPYQLVITRTDIPHIHQLDAAVLTLYRRALACGGAYDGWDCPVMRE